MSWKVDPKFFDRLIKCEFCGRVLPEARLTVEGSRIFFLSNDPWFDGCRAREKYGFRSSYWIADAGCTEIGSLRDVQLLRKFNHEQE